MVNSRFKFRAWFNLKNKMVESENLAFQYEGDEENPLVFAFDKTDIDENGNEKGTMCFILMQYTGLKDKNGKEIYEGDLLTDYGEAPPLYVEYSEEHGAYCFVDKFDPSGTVYYTPQMIYYEQMEVIGNIYENPELLEG